MTEDRRMLDEGRTNMRTIQDENKQEDSRQRRSRKEIELEEKKTRKKWTGEDKDRT